MNSDYEKMFNQQLETLNTLKGDKKKDYYISLFTSVVMMGLYYKRKEKGLNQSDVAKLMGVKQSYISKIENLEKVPTIETIARYCYALDYSLSDFKDLVDNMINTKSTINVLAFKK